MSVLRINIAGDQFVVAHRPFRCVRWDTENALNSSASVAVSKTQLVSIRHRLQQDAWEYMFVTESPGTGCRPRYTCVQFKSRSKAVMYYRISQPEV